MEIEIEYTYRILTQHCSIVGLDKKHKLDLAFNNVKPKDWYFVLD